MCLVALLIATFNPSFIARLQRKREVGNIESLQLLILNFMIKKILLVIVICLPLLIISCQRNDLYKFATTEPVISLNITSTSIAIGSTVQLIYTSTPSYNAEMNVTWTSSNLSVATVSSGGLVTGVTPGSTTITIMAADGIFDATCVVTVKNNITFVGVGLVAKSQGSTANLYPGIPTGVQPGDLLCLFETGSNTTTAVTTTGWTQGTGAPQPAYWKRATGSDAGIGFYPVYASDTVCMIVAFRGVVTTGSPFGTTGSFVYTPSTQTIAISPITTTYPFEYVVAWGAYFYNTNMTGWTTWSGPATTLLTVQDGVLTSVSDGIVLYTLPAVVSSGTTVSGVNASIVSWAGAYEYLGGGIFTLIPGP